MTVRIQAASRSPEEVASRWLAYVVGSALALVADADIQVDIAIQHAELVVVAVFVVAVVGCL